MVVRQLLQRRKTYSGVCFLGLHIRYLINNFKRMSNADFIHLINLIELKVSKERRIIKFHLQVKITVF